MVGKIVKTTVFPYRVNHHLVNKQHMRQPTIQVVIAGLAYQSSHLHMQPRKCGGGKQIVLAFVSRTTGGSTGVEWESYPPSCPHAICFTLWKLHSCICACLACAALPIQLKTAVLCVSSPNSANVVMSRLIALMKGIPQISHNHLISVEIGVRMHVYMYV